MPHERRIFVDEDLSIGSKFKIPHGDSHHLKKVLRLNVGDELVVVQRASTKEYVAKLVSWESEQLYVERAYEKLRDHLKVSAICPALCKGSTNDLVVEKSTELGVEKILFWNAKRSIIRFDHASDLAGRRTRFQKIAEEASKQSARNSVPTIEILPSLAALLEALSGSKLYWGSLSQDAKAVKALVPFYYPTYIIIGPEGDFSYEEEELLGASKAIPFSLGSNRLKVETAVISSIVVFNEISRDITE